MNQPSFIPFLCVVILVLALSYALEIAIARRQQRRVEAMLRQAKEDQISLCAYRGAFGNLTTEQLKVAERWQETAKNLEALQQWADQVCLTIPPTTIRLHKAAELIAGQFPQNALTCATQALELRALANSRPKFQ